MNQGNIILSYVTDAKLKDGIYISFCWSSHEEYLVLQVYLKQIIWTLIE